MAFISMLLVGLIIGALAKLIMPGHDLISFLVTILVGIAGSLVTGILGRSLGWYMDGAPGGFIASVVGAIVILLVYRAALGTVDASEPVERPL